MKKLILILSAAGLLAGCECGTDLYRSSYEIPQTFCWEKYGNEDTCDHYYRSTYSTYRSYPIYVARADIRVYKGPVYNCCRTNRCEHTR